MEKLFSMVASPLPFIVLISIVITVHELGHYYVGRFFGAAVESFSVGFGKSIVELKDKRGTRWRINWLPLGGFVKFVGEMQGPADDRGAPIERPIGKAYPELGPWKRIAVSLGGPFANFILAIIVFAALGMGVGVPQASEVHVTQVEAGSPAEAAGFKIDDIVLSAGGRPVASPEDVKGATFLRAGESVRYDIIRDGQKMELTAVPAEFAERNDIFKTTEKVGRIGLGLAGRNLNIRHLNPVEAVGYGLTQTGDTIGNTITVLRRLVTGRDGLEKMSGPVGIFSLTDHLTDAYMKQQGVSAWQIWSGYLLDFARLAAMLSIGVGFFNLLPIPVLDGGAVVMCLAELVTGRDLPERVQRIGLTIGLACLASFALVITWQDISRIFAGSGGP